MSLNYEQIKSQLQSYKPKWESKKTQLEAITIPEDFPFKEFFNASRDIFLQGYEFGKIISEDGIDLSSKYGSGYDHFLAKKSHEK